MSVRTVVQLAIVVIGIVTLYLGTSDRWNWAKLMRGAIVVLTLLVGGVAGGIYWSSLPPTSPVSDIWDISLGASKGDVRFLKGEPSEVIEPGTWVYVANRTRTYYLVFGSTDEIIRVLVVPGPGYSSGVSLHGVRKGFDAQRLVEQLGEPSRVIRLSNDIRRAYLYTHLNALFILEQGTVVCFGIYDVDAGDPYAEGGDDVGMTSSRQQPRVTWLSGDQG